MKYLKKFENKEQEKKYFWSVRNDKYYLIKQLNKINCPEIKIEEFTNDLRFYSEDTLFVYFDSTALSDIWKWGITPLTSNIRNNDFQYLGTIRLNSEEIKEVEAEKNSEKFNI